MALVAGPYSEPVSTETVIDAWWIKHPSQPHLNMSIEVINDVFDMVYPEDSAAFSPLGRTEKVTVRDVIRGGEGQLIVEFLSEDSWQKFKRIWREQSTLLLQSPIEQWYIDIQGEARVSIIDTVTPQRQFACQVIEVSAP